MGINAKIVESSVFLNHWIRMSATCLAFVLLRARIAICLRQTMLTILLEPKNVTHLPKPTPGSTPTFGTTL